MDNYKEQFSQIYDQYIDKIYRFVYLKVNSQEIAEDITSKVFLRGWEAYKTKFEIRNSKFEIKNIGAFLYQIARNLVTDHYREKGRAKFVSIENSPIIDPNQGLEEKAILSSDVEAVRHSLSDLKEDYQNVIIWHYLDDLSIPEVAKMLGRTEEATRVLLHRALGALRSKINQV